MSGNFENQNSNITDILSDVDLNNLDLKELVGVLEWSLEEWSLEKKWKITLQKWMLDEMNKNAWEILSKIWIPFDDSPENSPENIIKFIGYLKWFPDWNEISTFKSQGAFSRSFRLS